MFNKNCPAPLWGTHYLVGKQSLSDSSVPKSKGLDPTGRKSKGFAISNTGTTVHPFGRREHIESAIIIKDKTGSSLRAQGTHLDGFYHSPLVTSLSAFYTAITVILAGKA